LGDCRWICGVHDRPLLTRGHNSMAAQEIRWSNQRFLFVYMEMEELLGV
jgi:hypothetical protein